jgi:hypothetical protein
MKQKSVPILDLIEMAYYSPQFVGTYYSGSFVSVDPQIQLASIEWVLIVVLIRIDSSSYAHVAMGELKVAVSTAVCRKSNQNWFHAAKQFQTKSRETLHMHTYLR